jgi:HlyD family secretion protein
LPVPWPAVPRLPARQWRAAVALLAACASIGVAGCRERAEPTVLVLNGRIEAPTVDLAAKIAGRVVEVRVREGDRVKAGDLLVRLDIGEAAVAVERDRRGVESARARYEDLSVGSRQAEVAAARAEVADRDAALELARRELQRQQQLISKKVGTPRDLDRARSDVERAEAAVQASRERLQIVREGSRRWQTEQARVEVDRARSVLDVSETIAREAEVRAPADGVVLHRLAEPGQLLALGQPSLTMAFADRLYVRTFVPEPRLGQVRPGLAVQVRVDAFPDRTFAARVAEISPDAEFTPKAVETRAERVNLVYAAKVDLDTGWNAPLVPGQPAEVLVALGPAAATAPAPGASIAPGASTPPGAATTPAPAASSTPPASTPPAAPRQ